MPPRPTKTTSAGVGQRPWPGIAGPHCYYCSWAYRGRWPFGRMEVKFVNGMCTRHWRAVMAPTSSGVSDG